MKSFVVLCIATLAAAIAYATPAKITYAEVSFDCTKGKPVMNSWYMNTYTSKGFALRFTSESDPSLRFNGHLLSLYGPKNSEGTPSYIVPIGQVLERVKCQWTGNNEMIESGWYAVTFEDGLSLAVTQGPQYVCHSVWSDDKKHEVTEPTNVAMSVGLGAKTYLVQPGQCQYY